jgi:hypothetical protein
MREADRTAILPAHIEETVQAIEKLHAEHRNESAPPSVSQRKLRRMAVGPIRG